MLEIGWRGTKIDCSSSSLDFLLLDPPRTGAESRVIANILEDQAETYLLRFMRSGRRLRAT